MWLSSSNARGNLPFPLSEGKFLIGRSSQCQIIVLDPTVSRVHAQLTYRNNGMWIEDLGSRHGTQVQGRNITRAELRGVAELRLGNASLHLSEQRFLTPTSQAIAAEVTQTNLLPQPAYSELAQSLTSRQGEVLALLVEGLSPKEVAIRLARSPETIHTHVRKIYETFQVHSQIELLALIIRTT